MFTSQKSSRWSLSGRIRDGLENGAAFLKDKGKSVAEASAPPQASLFSAGGEDVVKRDGDPEIWRRFQEAGMLDQSSIQKKDREALTQRISELEKELYEYQYNMGLLLIEKRDWSYDLEEATQALAVVDETLKREHASNLVAISNFEKREDKLRKALGIEKQYVSDLEKALHEMRSEIAETKFTSEKKLSEAHALEAGLEAKYLEIEEKLHKADANLAEASRKRSDVERKLDDLEDRERKLQKDYQSFNSERKMHEKDIAEQKKYLRDWEKKMQDNHKRSLERQQVLNEREDHANEAMKLLEKKEFELEEAKKIVDAMKDSLKIQEEDIITRLNFLVSQEKKADHKIERLDRNEKELIAREKELASRERGEINKLLDEQNAMLDSKRRAYELELENRRKSANEEFDAKVEEMELKREELDHREDQLIKREQALEMVLQKLNDKESDAEVRSKALKKWEESLRLHEDEFNKERQQLSIDQEELLKSKSKHENLKATIDAGKEQIIKGEENLRLKREEREEYLLLQSKLKQEIEDNKIMRESLSSDKEDLRRQKEKFEEEWELLDEQKLSLERERNKFDSDVERLEKWRSSEEERLKNEGLEVKTEIERDLGELRQNKEAFEKKMEHERLDTLDFLKRERSDMDRELELRKHELVMDMQKKQEDMEKKLNDRVDEFERKRDMELGELKSLSNLNETKLQKLKIEKDQLDREKEDIAARRKQLEVDQLDVQKDIDSLSVLSKNLKHQREELIKERDLFLALVEECKICKSCGHQVCDLKFASLPDSGYIQLQQSALKKHLKAKKTETSPKKGISHLTTSDSPLPLLQRCSKVFKLSPGKKSEEHCPASLGTKLDKVISEPAQSYKPDVDSLDMAESDSGIRDIDISGRSVKGGDEPEPSFVDADNSTAVLTQTNNNVRKSLHLSFLDQSEKEVSSIPLKDDSQLQMSKRGRRQVNNLDTPKTIRRTHTMKEVVEEAKVIIGDTLIKEKDGQHAKNVANLLNTQEDSQGYSFHADMVEASASKKRHRADMTAVASSELVSEDSETNSENISIGGHRKRRQISVPGVQTPGEKRYNFRRSTIVGTPTGQTLNDQAKKSKIDGNKKSKGRGTAKQGIKSASEDVADSTKASGVLQQKSTENVTEAHEIFSQKLVEHDVEELHAPADSNINIVDKAAKFRGPIPEENGFRVDGAVAEASQPAAPDGESSEDEGGDGSVGKKLWTFFTT